MKALKFRPKARTDLDGIWAYSVENWGTDQAQTYFRGIQRVLDRLIDGTGISLSAENVLERCRKVRVASHVVYFQEDSDEIVVIRILHQRMDVARSLR
ncbi:type II toxin-antitoxin system RelE/ParE family toxin [Sulfitobacter sp. F26204]|uniref:type II toxin-antitoxin system RelE/ParE family toxin n=1 Tax=Sulfitobacter sp. F26204 TaxID=2996014 RepID=UPI003A4C5228